MSKHALDVELWIEKSDEDIWVDSCKLNDLGQCFNIDNDLTRKWDAVEVQVACELQNEVEGPEVSKISLNHNLDSKHHCNDTH
jgi:hypothetical protein